MMRKASLTSNGDGTGRLEIVIDGVRVQERKPGVYDVVTWIDLLDQQLKCGDEVLRPKLVLKLFCQSRKSTRFMKLKQRVRLRKLEKLHAG